MAMLGELIVKIAGDTGDLDKSIDSADKRLSKFATSAVESGKKLSTFVTLPILGMGAAFLALADKQQRAEAALTNAIRATGRQATISVDRLMEYASALQAVTTFGDEAQLSALALVQQLADLDEDGLKRVLPGMLDFAEAMGVDLQTAASLVGKTLGSSTNALARYGIEIDTTLEPTEKLAQLTQQLETRFGGAAEAAALAGLGPLRQLKNAAGDLGEEFGDILIPMLNDVVSALQDMVSWVSDLDDSQKRLIVTVAGAAAAVGPLLIGLGSAIRLFTTLRPLVISLNAALAANPAIFVTAAIVGLGIALVAIISHLNDATREQRAYREELDETVRATRELGDEELARTRSQFISQRIAAAREALQAQRDLIAAQEDLAEVQARNTAALRGATNLEALRATATTAAMREAQQEYDNATDRVEALAEAIKAIDDEIEQRTLPLRQQQAAVEAQAEAEREAAATKRRLDAEAEAAEAEQRLKDAQAVVRRIIEGTRTDYEKLTEEIEYLRSLSFIDDEQAEADRLRAIEILDERRQLIVSERERAEREASEAVAAERAAQRKLEQAELDEHLAEEARKRAEANEAYLEREAEVARQEAEARAEKIRLDKAMQDELDRHWQEARDKQIAYQKQVRAAYLNLANDIMALSTALADRQIAEIERTVGSEKDRDEQIRQIHRREAVRRKALGLYNVAISTYEAIMGFLKDPGGAWGIALSVAAGIAGALQAAAIAAQPIPQLAGGGIVPARPGGTQALIGEGGQPEVVFPLDRLEEFLSHRPGVAGPDDTPIHLTVELDTQPIFEKVFSASKDRRILIDARSVV